MIPTIFLSALCTLTTCTAASPLRKRSYPSPEPCTGNCTWIHDPNVVHKDNTYYRFSTSGNIAIATAPSLTGPWEYEGPLLKNGTSIFVANGQDIWAPDVTLVDDTYYAYYAVSTFGSQKSQIGVATSKALMPGTWTDHGSLGIPASSSYNLIDPNLFVDPDKKNALPYMVFGSYWDGIFQGPVTDLLSYEQGILTNLASNHTSGAKVVEGAFQFKHNNFYYLFFSSGACCNTPPNLAPAGDEYSILVCRAASVTGPYTDDQGRNCATKNGGTTVLASHGDVYAPGGQGVMIEEGSGRVVVYYHYVKPSVGYAAEQFFFGFNYLDFATGWPMVV